MADSLDCTPHVDFYSNTIEKRESEHRRPTLQEMAAGRWHNAVASGRRLSRNFSQRIALPTKTTDGAKKFGWIEGVFVRCVQNIIGVILFLRLTWITGQAGIGLAIMIVLLSTLVTTVTAISTSAIATNGQIKGGGLYYLISRTLGPEFGGSIGVIFALANCVGGALYIVGFSETVQHNLAAYGISIIDGGSNDVRVIGAVACTVLMGIIVISTSVESKLQQVLLIPLAASICSFYIGSCIFSTDKQIKGYTGYSLQTFSDNFMPSFQEGASFFSVFAVFFPAATGIMAGANISGDLKKPQTAIPKGTLLAIVVCAVIYLSVIIISGFTFVRTTVGVTAAPGSPDCNWNNTCSYGLLNYYQIVTVTSIWPALITFGIIASSVCSALASLVSAPKIFQAVCRDKVIPVFEYFGKGYGKNDEPRRAYLLSYLLTLAMVLIGEINTIAPFISNLFLCSYTLVNYSCFNASFSRSPGFRPAFPFYNMWLSLFGSIICIVIMFIMSWFTALLTFFFFAVIYMVIKKLKPDANWGASTDANLYRTTLKGIHKLTKNEEHVKNYRPQILLMCGELLERSELVVMGQSITRSSSLLICANIIIKDENESSVSNESIEEQMRSLGVKCIYKKLTAATLAEGCTTLCQLVGLGRLTPNIAMFGLFRGTSSQITATEYTQMIRAAFSSQLGVLVYRTNDNVPIKIQSQPITPAPKRARNDKVSDSSMNYSAKSRKGVIDVWWLNDDGGLTLLIPYLLTLQKSHLEGSRLRIFTVASKRHQVTTTSDELSDLLKLFRIPVMDLHVILLPHAPTVKSTREFDTITDGLRHDGLITQSELNDSKSLTTKHLTIKELLLEHSAKSHLIVLTLPFPSEGVNAYLYIKWLDILSKDLPQTLFIRGNHQSVLTFYS